MKVLQFDFGRLRVGDRIIIGEIFPEQHVEENHARAIHEIAQKSFGRRSWAYISNRKHSYAMNPYIHKLAAKSESNLSVYCVVSYRPITEEITKIEQNFKGGNYEFIVCTSLDQAIKQVQKILGTSPL